MHINCLELEAVRRALDYWAPALRGHNLTMFIDNTTAVAYINRQGGTRSRIISDISASLWTLCQELDIHPTASYLAGKDNVVADAISRGRFNNGNWSLNQHWLDLLFQIYGRPNIDLFASCENRRLPTFCTRGFHPQAWKMDTFSFEWDSLVAVYAFPPWCLLQRVLSKLSRSRDSRMLLITPCWPSRGSLCSSNSLRPPDEPSVQPEATDAGGRQGPVQGTGPSTSTSVCLAVNRRRLRKAGISEGSTELVCSARWPTTGKSFMNLHACSYHETRVPAHRPIRGETPSRSGLPG